MSYKKCSYCECVLGIESKDVTIDHFLPKSVYEDKVVEWENLFPACLRCNRAKKDNLERLINPCQENPKEYLGVSRGNTCRLKGIDEKNVGKNTITEIDLNNVERVIVPRMIEYEKIHNNLEEIYEDIREEGLKNKYVSRLKVLMRQCTKENSYSAVKATNLLNDEVYLEIKKLLQKNSVWSDTFQAIEKELEEIAFCIV